MLRSIIPRDEEFFTMFDEPTGAIIGVGAPTRLGAIRWGMPYRIVWVWILAIPASALTAALTWMALEASGLAGGG